MTNLYYKPIVRRYLDEFGKEQVGMFRAQGQWANGKLAYTLFAKLDKSTLQFKILSEKEIEEDQASYIQCRDYDGLIMEHI